MIARFTWAVNAVFRKFVYRNFVRHPEVNDYETNTNVGHGFGLARTIDPLTQILRVIRYMGIARMPFSRNFSIIDLGCGDGFMLKGFDFVGFKNLTGIELDKELAFLAAENVIRAKIHCVDFSSPDFSDTLGRSSYAAVFAFNPAPANKLIYALKSIAEGGSFVLFLRNPKFWTEVSLEQDLCFEILGKPSNMVVARVSSATPSK